MALRLLHKASLQNQTIPETPTQPDALDEPDAGDVPQGYRQVNSVISKDIWHQYLRQPFYSIL